MNDYKLDIKYSDFRTQIMTVKELVEIWNGQELQNESLMTRIPSREQCSRYVESLLVGMPLPPIYVDSSEKKWIIIEGADRIKAYADFSGNEFPLMSLYFTMNKYEGNYYDDMSNLAKRNILNAKIQVNVLNPGLSRQERFGIYTSLKSRIDADTLRSCRKHLYKENYSLIVGVANEIVRSSAIHIFRSPFLENEICHLLISSSYKDWMQQEVPIHLDAAVNGLLDDPCFCGILDNKKDKIIKALKQTRGNGCAKSGANAQDLYNAVVFHSEKKITIQEFLVAYRATATEEEKKNNTIDFCIRLQQILNILSKS